MMEVFVCDDYLICICVVLGQTVVEDYPDGESEMFFEVYDMSYDACLTTC